MSPSTSNHPPAPADCPVVELRQYTLHPGRRDELIDLFDREFVETQEAVGLAVIGQFRDLDDSDRFAWLLRPAWPGAGLAPQRSGRAAPGASTSPPGVVVASVCPLLQPADA